jgi:hypothetical protein
MYVETVRRVSFYREILPSDMPTEFQRGEHFVHREIAGEHLLVALRRDAAAPIFAMTPTAAAIWDRLVEWTTVEELVAHVVSAFDVTREVAAQDVRDFLDQLDSAKALRSRQGAT